MVFFSVMCDVCFWWWNYWLFLLQTYDDDFEDEEETIREISPRVKPAKGGKVCYPFSLSSLNIWIAELTPQVLIIGCIFLVDTHNLIHIQIPHVHTNTSTSEVLYCKDKTVLQGYLIQILIPSIPRIHLLSTKSVWEELKLQRIMNDNRGKSFHSLQSFSSTL